MMMIRPTHVLDLAEVHEADQRLYAPRQDGLEGFELNTVAADAVDHLRGEYAARVAEADAQAERTRTAKTRAIVDHAVRLEFERAGVDPRLARAAAAVFTATFHPHLDRDVAMIVIEHPTTGWAGLPSAVAHWLRTPDGVSFNNALSTYSLTMPP